MQDQIADRVGLLVGTPPEVLFPERVETRANLAGIFVQQPAPDDLQKLGVEGCVHGAQ